ncbi:hypothetical protein PAXRUDRAFT_822860 [Paxillus rubicundulus Ve08.2h10]|uniref:Mitochondrial intermembrane space import and assembly protein 40 n=1 Tax=Paxillus rubicundulus Ve08.2h10 TaxID=930991 RepID=A0A0D0DW14_9AGAM|nr:hypothetical protein PAXRUDRAFT_822860 [Paxillus rubicundulus Ve08.2h10]
MFRQFARLPLRRCLHSQARVASPRTFPRYSRAVQALGISVTVAAYLAWSLSSNGRHISLESEISPAPKRRPTATEPASSLSPPDDSTPLPSAPSKSDAAEQPAIPEKNGDFGAAPPVAESEGEQEGTSAGAFNPETGEINWDCPCLGGMAHGPCGEQFREAFSCFVFSEKEPKGIDCVEKFKAMQDCFREHPDVYGEEIMDDDDEEGPAGSETSEGNSRLPETPSAEHGEQPTPTSS